MSVLLICTANVCRSPAAEFLWRAAAEQRGLIEPAYSAGIQAIPGQPIHRWFANQLANDGIDASAQRSRRFTRSLAMRCDLILVMELRHQRYLLEFAPELAGRVHLLGRWTVGVIQDPIGREDDAFVTAYRDIRTAVESWLDRLQVAPGTLRRHAQRSSELPTALPALGMIST